MKRISNVIAGIVLVIGVSAAQAATISLSPTSAEAPQGGQVAFDLIANFGADSPIGGAIDIQWGDPSVITFASFAFDSGFGVPPRDAAFDILDTQSSNLVSVGFGNFSGISIPTDTVIGTIRFNTVGAPGTETAIQLQDSAKWGGFYDTTGAPISVSYSGATAKVAAVPLPVASWLFLSGLGTLAGIGRQRSRAGA
jgi:hypothetical protein